MYVNRSHSTCNTHSDAPVDLFSLKESKNGFDNGYMFKAMLMSCGFGHYLVWNLKKKICTIECMVKMEGSSCVVKDNYVMKDYKRLSLSSRPWQIQHTHGKVRIHYLTLLQIYCANIKSTHWVSMHFRLIWPMWLWVRGCEDLYWDILTVRVFWLISQTPFEYCTDR